MNSSANATTDWRPALRPEVERMLGRDGVVSGLRQPGTRSFVRIGRVSRSILDALDGTRTLDAVLETAVRAGASLQDGEDAVRALLLLNFLEGAGDAIFERLVALDDEEPRLVFLEESRFTCHGTGQCCRVYALGPLDEEDVQKLESLDLASAFPGLGPGPHVREDDNGNTYLERQDEHCVFLLPNGLCGIHAKFGPEAKPKVCRLYPWGAQLTVAGLRITDQSECSTFARSVRAGEPLRAQLDRVRALLPRAHEIHHPLVLLDAEHPCDYGWILALETKVQPLLGEASPVGPAEAMLVLGRLARGLADALAVCTLRAGEPDATVARVLAGELVPGAASAPTPEGLAAIARVAEALLTATAGRSEPLIPRLRTMLEGLAELPRLAGGPSPGDPELLGATLRASLANAVFGGRVLADGRLRAGLLRLALIPILTIAGARQLARERGLAAAGEAEISQAHMAAAIGLRMPTLKKAIAGVEASVWEVLPASAGIVAEWARVRAS